METTETEYENGTEDEDVANGSDEEVASRKQHPLFRRVDRGEYGGLYPTPTTRPSDRYANMAFLVCRVNANDRKEKKLIIKSKELGAVITLVLAGVEGLGIIGQSSQIYPQILYHFIDDFKAFDLTAITFIGDENKAKEHLGALILFLTTEYKFEVIFFNQLLTYPRPQITFNLLWLIFRPNILLLSKDKDDPSHRLYLLLRPLEMTGIGITLLCKSVNFDGTNLGFETKRFTIRKFTGLREIVGLEPCPLGFHPNSARLETELVNRGRKFVELCTRNSGRVYVHCTGRVEGSKDKAQLDLDSRVMLDPAMYWKSEGSAGRMPSIEKVVGYLNENHYKLCNASLPGFIMKHKIWGFIQISQITDITWVTDMLSHVTIDKTTKDLLRGFVSAHTSVGRLEIVPGKGVGLIMLFTGPPGVGKTITAEAVAEISCRPLYSISASELGCEPDELDRNLARILQRGALWGSVLLLDEADVFLEQRTSFDVKRNALVSIFLRQLEYYTGIIILTSNRVETFDKALESRVHFNLHFNELDRGARMQLWTYFLHEAHQGFSSGDLSRLSDLKFNGRMIQHSVSLGRSLAMEREEYLTYAHIQQVLRFVDPTWRAQRISGQPRDEFSYDSPLDPVMSTAPTPATTYDTPIPDPYVGSKRPRFG